jgi:acetate kinase
MGSPPLLALNCGSSSLKFAVFETTDGDPSAIARGSIDRIGGEGGRLWMRTRGEKVALERAVSLGDHRIAVDAVFEAIAEADMQPPRAVGHRVVLGASDDGPCRVDEALLQSLRELVPRAPLHLLKELACIEAVTARGDDLPQVACFDTSFFSSLPEIARRLPLPASLEELGVRRRGLHGLSYESIAVVRGIGARGKSILAHLGSGSSMVALRDGNPVDTTTGFTPSGGFMMGTRSGDIDPGILFYLLGLGYDAGAVEQLLLRESGLLGLSQTSADMLVVLERRARDERAALAFEMFCYQAKKAIGSLVAVLGGIDALVFTGGIGQNAAPVRERICAGLAPFGIRLDDAQNRGPAPDVISAPAGPCTVRVATSDEELVIARQMVRVLGDPRPTG